MINESSQIWLSAVIALTLAPGCGARSELAAENARGDTGGSGPPPPPAAVCTDLPRSVPTPETFAGYNLNGYDPPLGHTVGRTGQIKVWVGDWTAPFIAPGEMVDNVTGAITAPGDRMATAVDGLLYEPALYIAPQSPSNGGTPYFPQWIKGRYNNGPPTWAGWSTPGTVTRGAPEDSIPRGSSLDAGEYAFTGGPYEAEFVWDVSTLGLDPGTYMATFSVHGGSSNHWSTGCVTIMIPQ